MPSPPRPRPAAATLLISEAPPYAGGQDHYASYLASTDSFEVELVARET